MLSYDEDDALEQFAFTIYNMGLIDDPCDFYEKLANYWESKEHQTINRHDR